MFRSLAHRLVLLWGWRRMAVAFLAGAVSALGLAPVHLAPVLFLTIPVLVYLMDGAVSAGRSGVRRLRPAFAIGWWFGLGYFLAGLHWIGAAFFAEGPELIPLMPFAVLGLAGGLALFPAVGLTLARLLWSESPFRVFALSFGLTTTEWLRGHVLTGFPWNLIGQTVGFTDVTAQAASVVGVYGLTAAGLVVYAAPAVLGDEKSIQPWARRLTLAIAIALTGADVGYGLHRLAEAPVASQAPDAEGLRLRIVQPAIDQAQKWSPEFRQSTIDKLVEMSDRKTDPDTLGAISFRLIIWPETALPFFLSDEPAALERIADLLPTGTTLITGAPRTEPSDDGRRFYNSVYVIGDSGDILAAYDKVHLVPFGEYMPLESLLDRFGIGQLFKGIGGFSAGPRRVPIKVAGIPPFSALVCYEVVFPGVIEGAERPDFLVNLTNDGWFGRSSGPYQHLDQARLRAIEEGLPIIRAANTGISAIIDGYGRILSQSALGTEAVLDGQLPQDHPTSLFPRIGSTLLLTFQLILVMLVLTGRRKRRVGS